MSNQKEEVRKAYMEMQEAMIKKDMKKLNEIV